MNERGGFFAGAAQLSSYKPSISNCLIEKLAADGSVDRAYLGGMEREQENPSIDALDKVAAALGVSLAELLVTPAEGDAPPLPLRPGRKSAKGDG